MKSLGRFPKPKFIRTVLCVVIGAVGFTATILLVQDNPDLRRQAADQGAAGAQFDLGFRYATGEGVAQDEAEAVRWYRRAAEQDHASAQYNLGFHYNNGRGVPKDEAAAARWYWKAAEQGHASAQYNLGVSYATGEGVLKDTVLAHMWWNIAGANGDETARKNRDKLERGMTRAEISRATELARACMAADYQDCQQK